MLLTVVVVMLVNFFFNILNKILKVIHEKGFHIKFINVFDFENLFGSIPYSNIVKVCSDIYDDFSSITNNDKSFWTNLVKFCIFENTLYNGKDYLPMGHFANNF